MRIDRGWRARRRHKVVLPWCSFDVQLRVDLLENG